MRAPNGRRRLVAKGLGIVAAAAACVPATADAAALIAAYDRFVPSKGFDIGLVNVNTGAALSVPAAVNTTDDELHPTLTPDGRYLVFMRTKLQPKLNGDIVPPISRTLQLLDRQTGTVTALPPASGTGPGGPVFNAGGSILGWGIRPGNNAQGFFEVARRAPFTNGSLGNTSTDLGDQPSGSGVLEVPHAGVATVSEFDSIQQHSFPRTARYLSYAFLDASSGALLSGFAQLSTRRLPSGSTFGPEGRSNTFGSAGAPASHPVPRSGDNYTALDLANGNDVDIQTLSWPTETQLTPAPAAYHHRRPGADARLVARRHPARLRAHEGRQAQPGGLRRDAWHPERAQPTD